MKHILKVCIGSRAITAGFLAFDPDRPNCSQFVYADDFFARPEAFALSPDLPLMAGWQIVRRGTKRSPFPWAVSDCEPDSWGRRIIRRAFSKLGARLDHDLNALDYLLAVDDFSRVGALRFCEVDREPGSNEDGRCRTPTLIDLHQLFDAGRRLELDRETEEDLLYLEGRGTSLGGARPKCTLINEAGRLSLGKFASVADERDIAKGEILALRLAQSCGIASARGEVVMIGSSSVSVIERFDRVHESDERIPSLSAAAFLQRSEEDDPPASWVELFEMLIALSGERWESVGEEIFRRILFNMLVNNTDDHGRNTGLLMDDAGTWCLAPAFDLNPVPLKRPNSPYMSKFFLTPMAPAEDLRQVLASADDFGIGKRRAVELLAEVVKGISSWKNVARTKGVGMTDRDLAAYAPAFEHDRMALARSLAGGAA